MSHELNQEIEERLHALLNNQAAPAEQHELLLRVAREDETRRLLEEMLLCQSAARSALGLPPAADALERPSRRCRARLSWAGGVGGSGRRPARWLAIAAGVLLAVGLGAFLLVSHLRTQRAVEDLTARVTAASLRPEELDRYRRLWSEIAPVESRQPWVLLTDSGGRFEYLSGSEGGAAARTLALRCVLVSAEDGTVLEQVNVLVPAARPLDVDLGETGAIAGLPLRCELTAGDGWIGVGLRVGDASGGAGVHGRIRAGQALTEIGAFRVDERPVRVFLQAEPFRPATGNV